MSIYKGTTLVAGGGGCPFPVGMVTIMINNTNPSTYYPGTTWEQLADGKFLMNTTDSSKVGTNIAQQLPIPTLDEVPDHNHSGIFWGTSPMLPQGGSDFGYNYPATWASNGYSNALVSGNGGKHTPTVKADSVYTSGGTVRPNSIGCTMWKRTA